MSRLQAEQDARPRRTQHERRSTAEEALLDAAAELFAEQGIVETSLAQIGERAGYSRGLVNHHFGSKAELVGRLARRCQKRFPAHVLGRVDGLNGIDGILRIVDAYLRHFEAPTADGRALLVMWGATFPAGSSVDGIIDADQWARDAIAYWVKRGKRDGSISRHVDAAASSVALLGLIRGVAAQFLTEPHAIDMPAVRAQCARFVTDGLGAREPEESLPA